MGSLAGAEKPSKGRKCGLGRVYEASDAEDRAWIDDKLRNESGWTNSQIAFELSKVGHVNTNGDPIGYQVVQRHRSGVCSCG